MSVNACLFLLCATHGLAITTVEGVGSPQTGLHRVQEGLIKANGLQCGFCTPGFVMSAFTLLRNNPLPSTEDVEKALEGNLCRCTGYRQILEAFQSMKQEGCPLGDQCCKNRPADEPPSTTNSAEPAEKTQLPIFPPELQLSEKTCKTMTFRKDGLIWIAPLELRELAVLKAMHPDAPIIMGNTSALNLRRKGKCTSNILLYGGRIEELKPMTVNVDNIQLGAGLTFAELENCLRSIIKELPAEKTAYLPAFLWMITRYGADQIRNVATIGGSIVCSLPNSDLLPLLLCLDAAVTLLTGTAVGSEERIHRLLSEEKIPNDAVLKSVSIPMSQQGDVLKFFKVSDRRTFSMCKVNCAIFLRMKHFDNSIADLRLAIGGVGTKVFRATKSERKVKGMKCDGTMLSVLLNAISEEMKAAEGQKENDSNTFKRNCVLGMVFRFFQEVTARVKSRDKCHTGLACDTLTDSLPMKPCESTQLYEACYDKDQPADDAFGRPVPNASAPSIVSGQAIYTDDLPRFEHELFLTLVLSQKSHANIVSVDASAALRLPGVFSYLDHNDVPGENRWGAQIKDEEIFASTRVQYVGQPIGGVLAQSREIALKAAKLVKVEYQELKPILTLQEAITENSVFPSIGKCDLEYGSVDEAFRTVERTTIGAIQTEWQEHFYMEPFATIVVPCVEEDELDVYCPSQHLKFIQTSLARNLKIPESRIHIKVKRVGGGFGCKAYRTFLVAGPAAVAAHKTKRPVRCVLPREQDMLITGKRDPLLAKYKVGFMESGKIVAADIECYGHGGAFADEACFVMQIALLNLDCGYFFQNIRMKGVTCKTNLPPTTAMRGFGSAQSCVIVEDIILSVARALNKAPEEVRFVNLYREGECTPYRMPVVNCTIEACWNKCAEWSNFQDRRKQVEDFNKSNQWKKRGIAMTPMKFGMGYGAMSLNQGAALVHIYTDGSVLVSVGGVEMGQGLHTKMAQVASRALGVPMNKITVGPTATCMVPNAVATSGSFGTDICGPAVLNACTILAKRLEPYRKKNSEGSWEQWVSEAFSERVQLSTTGFNKISKEHGYDIHDKSTKGFPFTYFTFGVCCSQVEIDCVTGENQILRADIVMDIGKSLNPYIDIGQIEGGFVQGFGMMTSEEMLLSGGRFMNCSPLSYKIPNVRSIPREFNVTLLKNDKIVTPIYSSKGTGEPPLLLAISAFMAIKEAVRSARVSSGSSECFRFDPPATVQRIQLACGLQFKATEEH